MRAARLDHFFNRADRLLGRHIIEGNTENREWRNGGPSLGSGILVSKAGLRETRRHGCRRSQWVVRRIPRLCGTWDIHTRSSIVLPRKPMPLYCQQLISGFSTATASAAAKPAAGVNS